MFKCQVVWRYLLNVYPNGLSGQERMDYMKRKTREYEQLKREWRTHVSLEDLEFIRGNVLKDVLRTDRSHPYYAGSEDSPHLAALTDLLTTFAITHPQVGLWIVVRVGVLRILTCKGWSTGSNEIPSATMLHLHSPQMGFSPYSFPFLLFMPNRA